MWLPAAVLASWPSMAEHTYDVAVVGGRITGPTTALLLKRRGLSNFGVLLALGGVVLVALDDQSSMWPPEA